MEDSLCRFTVYENRRKVINGNATFWGLCFLGSKPSALVRTYSFESGTCDQNQVNQDRVAPGLCSSSFQSRQRRPNCKVWRRGLSVTGLSETTSGATPVLQLLGRQFGCRQPRWLPLKSRLATCRCQNIPVSSSFNECNLLLLFIK
jgi:hypothetical protein